MRAQPTVKRTKDEAKALAQKILGEAKAPKSDFDALAKKYSDDPGSGPNGGKLGVFERRAMVKPFADAAFGLDVNGVSNVIETDFGFHIIKRTQ